MNKKIIIILVILLALFTVIGVICMKKNNMKKNQNEDVGIIHVNSERQEYFVEYFRQYSWDLTESEFRGMTAVQLMSDENFQIANDYSKLVGLNGIEKYEMFKYAHTTKSFTLEEGKYSYEIDFMVQTESEKSKDIQFAVLLVRINSGDDEDDLKEWLYPVNTNKETIEKDIINYSIHPNTVELQCDFCYNVYKIVNVDRVI